MQRQQAIRGGNIGLHQLWSLVAGKPVRHQMHRLQERHPSFAVASETNASAFSPHLVGAVLEATPVCSPRRPH